MSYGNGILILFIIVIVLVSGIAVPVCMNVRAKKISNKTMAKKQDAVALIIPEGTTEIKYCEYENRDDIISVVIPEGVVKIETRAFCGCKNLESVVLPYGVECIMDSAFRNCKKLKTISNVWSVKEIRETAFSGCDSIDIDARFNIDRIITTSLSWEEMEQRGIDYRWPDKDYDPSYDPYGPRNWH